MIFFYLTGIYEYFINFSLFSKIAIWYMLVAKLTNLYFNTFILFSFLCFLNKYSNLLLLYFFYIKHEAVVSFISVDAIPLELSVGYNVVHPALFYLSYLLFFTFYFERFFTIRLLHVFCVSTFTLSLGGLWGFGNSVWGFYWVNDLIELILLYYVLFVLYLVHVVLKKSTFFKAYFVIFLFSLWVLSARWNLIFTRHSFFNLSTVTNFFLFVSLTWSLRLKSLIIIYLFLVNAYLYPILLFLIFLQFCSLYYNNIIIFKKFLIIFHIFFLVFFFTWIKLKENNLVIFFQHTFNFRSALYLSVTSALSNATFTSLNYFKLVVVKQFINFLYTFKIGHAGYAIYSSYSVTPALIFFLISTIKIYAG